MKEMRLSDVVRIIIMILIRIFPKTILYTVITRKTGMALTRAHTKIHNILNFIRLNMADFFLS